MRKRASTKRTNDPEGMRNRVLDVAARSFQQLGVGRTSMHDIQRKAKVSTGALYRHFPTKKDLTLAVIGERVSAEVADTWIRAIEDAPTAGAGILAVFQSTIDHLEEAGKVSGCPLGNLALELASADEDYRHALTDEYQSWRKALAQRLAREIADGGASYAGSDPEAFATVVVALFSGAMSIAKAEQRPAALRDCLLYLERKIREP